MTTQLESLKKISSVVADTGDIDSIQKFSPDDCTTNPSLIYKAVQSKNMTSLLMRSFPTPKVENFINQLTKLILSPINLPSPLVLNSLKSYQVMYQQKLMPTYHLTPMPLMKKLNRSLTAMITQEYQRIEF